mmetsp:Transcript_114399/g.286044  ORF Transcript_114399/g.286044 Transcript_114399/m.286044 type:complete len:201 (-) Transcript_114399:156-758(-)
MPIPQRAHVAARHTSGSGVFTPHVKKAVIATMDAMDAMPRPRRTPSDALSQSAMTLRFTLAAAMIQPKWRAKGARKRRYSNKVTLCWSRERTAPTRHARMPSMKQRDNGIDSCAKATVQVAWNKQAAHHQGAATLTGARWQKRGNICMAAQTPSHVKIRPQIEKMKPAGVTRVWYLALRSVLVLPKMPVNDRYVMAKLAR